jgi:hypothetical protein
MNEVKNKSYIECPKCGKQAKITSASSTCYTIGVASLLAGGCLLWIPVLGWICAPLAFLIGIVFIVLGIISSLTAGAIVECENCKTEYTLTKEEYKKYKKGDTSTQEKEYSFTDDIKETWNNSSNNHIFINKIEKLEKKIENTTNEKKIARMKKEIKRLEKHIK